MYGVALADAASFASFASRAAWTAALLAAIPSCRAVMAKAEGKDERALAFSFAAAAPVGGRGAEEVALVSEGCGVTDREVFLLFFGGALSLSLSGLAPSGLLEVVSTSAVPGWASVTGGGEGEVKGDEAVDEMTGSGRRVRI